MDKVKVEFKVPEDKMIEINGAKIKVNPFLDISKQAFLINAYLEEYFMSSEAGLIKYSANNYLDAEYKLMNFLFQISTDIDVDNLDPNVFADTVFCEKITSQIANYFDFRNKLNFIINDIKQQRILDNSLGKVLSDLGEKLSSALDKFSNIKPEDLEKATQAGQELLKELKDSSILPLAEENKETS